MEVSNIKYSGKVRLRVWEKQDDGTEKLIRDTITNNLLVNTGKESILKYLGNISGGGYFDDIGVGDSSTAASVGQTDLQASTNYLWKTIDATDRVYVTNTLYLSVDFGYSEANFTWNEIGLKDNQGSPLLIARVVDGTPLVKTSSKRAIVEWQITVS